MNQWSQCVNEKKRASSAGKSLIGFLLWCRPVLPHGGEPIDDFGADEVLKKTTID